MSKISTNKKERKLKRCLKVPFRTLIKARDIYVKGMMGCAGKFGNPSAGPSTGFHVAGLPKSFSTTSLMTNRDEEYIRDLIREASTKSMKDKLELEKLRAEVLGPRGMRGSGDVKFPRIQSLAVIARIDENAPCDFGADVRVNVEFVPRNGSHAIPKSGDKFV